MGADAGLERQALGAAERAVLLVDEGWAAGWRPDARLTVSEWADSHRVLPSRAASEPGPWRTSRTPFSREIMDCLSDHHPAQEVVVMAAVQIVKSEVGLNWAGYTIDHAPSSMLAVLPTVEVGERWSKQRMAPMIQDTPRLRSKVSPARSRDSGNTTLSKEFDGGILMITGANSAAGLSSMPIKKLLLDEVDRFPHEIEDEGDPVDIAEARTSNFPNRKIYKCSSPTIESLSRINKDWKRSDQRRYFVPCPHCGGMQHLRWDGLHYEAEKPEEARYTCEHCGALIDEREKTTMLERGEWRATFPEHFEAQRIAGFHLNALYSPIGLGRSWGWLAARYEEVKRDASRLKVFVNTRLGECYEDPDERLDWEELKSRAESYGLRTVPRGCLILTAGADVQKDRIEVQIVGWGRGPQCWVLDWLSIPGDPTRADVWTELEAHLARPIMNAFGVTMRTSATAVDAGYLTDEVLNFTRARRHLGIFAIKGASQRGRQIIGRPTKVDFTRRGTVIKAGAEMWVIGVDAAKHRLFAQLAGDRKQAMSSARLVHFSDQLPDDYFMQMSAEVFDPNKRAWVKLHNRHNEGLDTHIYAMVAAMHPRLRVHIARESDWAKLEEVIEPKGRDLFSGSPRADAAVALEKPHEKAESAEKAASESAEKQESPALLRQPAPRRGSNFATGWRR
jgi:phage terminase large subunit GpA-like protein